MSKKIAGPVLTLLLAVLLAALPLAAAPQDGERVEREAVAVAVAPAGEDGEARRQVVRVMVDEEGEVEVIEGDADDEVRRHVMRLTGEPGEKVRFFHAAPGGMPLFRSIDGKGFLGVHLVELTPELRAHFGAGEEVGLLVGRVDPGSPAEQAGLRVGDVLTRVGGEEVSGHWDVIEKVRPLSAGQGVALEVVRDGRVEALSATVVEREQAQVEAGALLRRLGEDGEVKVWGIDPEELGRRMGEVGELWASPEWRERVHTLTVTGEGLEERLAELEREIERLKAQLDERSPDAP
ncbi:MAG TPA: PDZ domain-containing protein [Thermoanaerobaculia bacterium]|nr:PDZ domain-containing protein [Thermoanaerobaculia bacterium]